ncbi:MAG TPA: Hsp70 family protein [Pyrinomonadaceae bacterium]|nr:Hsp70 family protein [Pyrinomonadaceae bacterium]
MVKGRRALIFANDATGGDPVLRSILQHLDIAPLLPHELSNQQDSVSVIIIERPAANALKILANLRKQPEFGQTPILVILDPLDSSFSSELIGLHADLLFKPVAFPALRRYLESKAKVPAAPAAATTTPSPKSQTKSAGDVVFPKPKPVEVSPLATGTKPDKSKVVGTPEQKPQEKSAPDSPNNRDGKKASSQTTTTPPPSSASARKDERKAASAAPAQPKPLVDLIPTSPRLMPREMRAPVTVKGGVPCANCRRWKARKEDAFCARCGAALIRLELPEEVVTFEPYGAHKVGALVDFRNAGQNPLQLAFELVANSQLGERFALNTEQALIEGGAAQHLLITFDARGLDTSTRYEAALQVATNERGYSKRQLKLVVERVPVARITPLPHYSYALGTDNVWEFKLSNDGGGTLRLASVRLDISQGIVSVAQLEPVEPVAVRGGQSVTVRLKVPPMELTPGTLTKKLTWEFEHLRETVLDFTFGIIRPARLVVQPVELDFGVLSSTRTRKLALYLINNGGEELTVESVTPSVPWLECLSERGLPLRIAPTGREKMELLVRGSREACGDHQGDIEIRSDSYQNPVQLVPFRAQIVEPEPYEEYIGIDFGTTASCVAVLDENYQLTLLDIDPTEQGDPRIMPSVLYFQSDGTTLAGREALEFSLIKPANAVRSIKRALGSKQTKIIAGQEYNPVAVTSKIIEQLVRRAEDGLFQLGEYKTPQQAVVTVPIEFNNAQRAALLESCRRAGLDMPSTSEHGVVIDEAHAAALYYLSRQTTRESEDSPEKVLIFDFGGGTLDCALVEIENLAGKMILRTLAPGGDPRLGGEDIDWKLARLLARKAKENFPEFDQNCVEIETEEKFQQFYRDPMLIEAAYQTRAAFKSQAEAAKIALTKADETRVLVSPLFKVGARALDFYLMHDGAPARFEATLKYEALEKVLEPFIVRASAVVETLCTRAGVRPDEIDTVLHAGRTSLLPMVRERINALLPNATDHSDLVEPKVCVALGAAFWGYIKDLPNANFEFVGVANRLMHDIGYLDIEGLQEVFRPVFPAQTEYPCERVVEMRRGDFINLRLAENRGKRTQVRDNPEISKIGKVRIDTRGLTEARLPITFRIDENQILEISANGHSQDIELD